MVAKHLFLFALAVAHAAPILHQNSTSHPNATLSITPIAGPSHANYSDHTTAEEVSSPNVLLRPTCPSGWGLFNISDVIVMEDVPLPLAWEGIGKFCEVGWQGFDLFDREGNCAKLGATRTYGIGNFKLSDRLEYIYETPSAKSQAASPPLSSSSPPVPAKGDTTAPHPHSRRSWTSWLPFGWGDSPPPPPLPAAHSPVAQATNKTMDASNNPNSGHRGKPIEGTAPPATENQSGTPGSAAPPLAALEGTNRHSGIVGHHYAPANNSGPTQFHAMVYTQIGESQMAGAKLSNITTLLKLTKAPEGTRVSWDVVGCSDSGKAIEALLKEMHEGAIANAGGRIRVANKIQPKKAQKPH